jgi:DNA-binding NarL/FixJ family response regulator
MTALDTLIQSLYGIAAEPDWRYAREKGLELVRIHFHAQAAAWVTTGEGGAGPLTETVHSGFTRSQLAGLKFTAASPVQKVESYGGTVRAARYNHSNRLLVSVLILRWADGVAPPADESLLSAVVHLAEAAALSQRLFVQRDEWLLSMGRSNRGAAALVDARGTVHADTERFRKLLEGRRFTPGQLPFKLPELPNESHAAIVHEGLHVRIERMDGLHLVHLREPLPFDILSPREQQIARALGAGKTFKSVAKQCDISISTVANHATRIYRKLGIFRREELVELIRTPGGPAKQPPTPKLTRVKKA